MGSLLWGRGGPVLFPTPTWAQAAPGLLLLQPLSPSEVSGSGQDEGQEGDGWPGWAPREHTHPGQLHSLIIPSAPGPGSGNRQGFTSCPQPSDAGGREAVQGGRGRVLALTYPWSGRRRRRQGWGQPGGSSPFPGPRRKGLCGAPAPSPRIEHIPGQRPGLLARAGPWG